MASPGATSGGSPASTFAGALHGAAAWAAYAAIEALAALAPPLLSGVEVTPQVFAWQFTAVLCVVLPALGFALGGVVGWLLQRARPDLPAGTLAPVAGTLPLVAAYGLVLMVREPEGSPQVAFAIVGILGVGLLARAFLRFPPGWLASLTASPVVALLLVVASFTGVQALPSPGLATATGVAMLALGGGLLWAGRGGSAPRALRAASLAIVVGLAASAVFVFGRSEPPFPEAPATGDVGPNVVLIVLDTVRADHLSLYGYERDTSPNLARFAEGATLYTHAVSPGDLTLTSHASLFTGLYPPSHGAILGEDGRVHPLSDEAHTLAEWLAGEGYATVGAAANHTFFGRWFGLDQGFVRMAARAPVSFELEQAAKARSTWLRPALLGALAAALPAQRRRMFPRADTINARAFRLLDEVGERPFLLFLNYMEGHWPYLPPEPWNDRYPGRDADFEERDFIRVLVQVVDQQARHVTDAERAHLTSQYDGALAYLDSQIGVLFADLERRGLWDRSLVIVTSDHGEALGDRDLVGHGLSVHQDQVHVPLLVKLPGQKEGSISHARVSLVDVLPTLHVALGRELPEGLQGQSLVPDAPADDGRMVLSVSYPAHFPGDRFDRTEYALFAGSLKLIESDRGRRELYDLAADPGETLDLYPTHPDSALLDGALAAWLDASDGKAVAPSRMDDETLDHLRALGYVRDE